MPNKATSTRGNASQFFVAGELCRRDLVAVVTMGNTPNTDILCSDLEGTRFAHIQVKTFVPGNTTCSVGLKAEKDFGENFFWVLGGIPKPGTSEGFRYFIIPAAVMAKEVRAGHQRWLRTPGRGGRSHQDNAMRVVWIPPAKSDFGWDIAPYESRWDLIEKRLHA